MEYQKREYRHKKEIKDPYYYEIAYELGLDYAKDLKRHQEILKQDQQEDEEERYE